MGCGCMKGRSRGGLGSLAGHPSKTKLAEALRELGFAKQAESVEKGNCEAYGRKVFCYPCFASFAQRREVEAKLEERGFKVGRNYGSWPGRHGPEKMPCTEVAVGYFKAWHWDE